MLWALFKKKFFFQKILIEDWRISQKNLAPLGKKIDLLPDEVKIFHVWNPIFYSNQT